MACAAKVGDYIFSEESSRSLNRMVFKGVVTRVVKSRVYYVTLPEIEVYLCDSNSEYERWHLPLPLEILGLDYVGEPLHDSMAYRENYLKDSSISLAVPDYESAYMIWRQGHAIVAHEHAIVRYLMKLNSSFGADAPYFGLPELTPPTLKLCNDVSLHRAELDTRLRPYIDALLTATSNLRLSEREEFLSAFHRRVHFDWAALSPSFSKPSVFTYITSQNADE